MSSLRHSPFVSPRARVFLPVLALVLGLALWGPVAPVAQADPADHLVLAEFLVKTRAPLSSFGSPFIEVMNPTAGDVDMSHVYLTDATYSTSSVYYNITLGDVEAGNPGGGNGGDFHARFPDGFVLPAGASVVISLNGSAEYFEAYGVQPDFELYEDAAAPDAIPELVEAFPGSIGAGPLGGSNVPALSDVAESLVLYTWDGSSDDVQDLDYVTWGSNTAVRVDKTGVTIGTHTYLDDTAVAGQDPVAAAGPTFMHAFQRVSSDEGSETLSGGNGVGGHDETSENLSVTWADVTPSDPTQSSGVTLPAAAPIVTALAKGTAVEGAAIGLSASVVSPGSVTGMDFYFSIAGGDFSSVAGASDDGATWTASLPAQNQGTEVAVYCVATNDGGASTVYPSGAPVFPGLEFTVQSPNAGAQKLLITEVCVGPNIYPFTSMAQIAPEFVEIHNPNDFEMDLTYYHLTDAIRYEQENYWLIADGLLTQGDIGGGHYNDFVARFPAGYILPAHGTITISVAGSSWFEQAYGRLPDLELYEDDAEADDVPDMEPVFQNPSGDLPGDSIYTADRPTTSSDNLPKGIPELEEHYGEPLVLYYYKPGDDLVVDVDMFIWGTDKDSSYGYGFQKGPAANNGSGDYANDTALSAQDWHTALDESGTVSFTRVDAEEGTQATTGGNGVGGRDETSENMSVTFEILDPTPGVFLAGGGDPSARATLTVPARTFNPNMGESFPIQMIAPDDSEVRLRVFDREGRLVKTLWDSRFQGSVSSIIEFPSEVNWNGRDDTYEYVPAGLYILHLSVVDRTSGEEETQTAPVVVATRLSN